MRTDAKVSKRKVKLPHISVTTLLGYDKNEAAPGDIIVFDDPNIKYVRYGRVIGRVDAPALGESPVVRGHICIVASFDPFGNPSEFWVPPEFVTRCIDGSRVRRKRDEMNWLLAEDFLDQPIEVLRSCGDKSPWFDAAAMDAVQVPAITIKIGIDSIGYQKDVYVDGKIVQSGCNDFARKFNKATVVARILDEVDKAMAIIRKTF